MNPWATKKTPAPGPARAIGGYSAGCIAGAVALPLVGEGYRVGRPGRGRVFGHPTLIAFLRALGQGAAKAGLGTVWLGDLGQPRGGPAPSGHASHQTGLDVDVAYGPPRADSPPPTEGRKASVDPQPPVMVDLATRKLTAAFTPQVAALIQAAASDAHVDRLFVNPSIKRALCERAPAEDRAWLHKVRPWWGHHDHFHVRLPCPPDSPECQPQAPLAPGDGCGELDWWFKPEADGDRKTEHQKYRAKVGALPLLPDGCKTLLE